MASIIDLEKNISLILARMLLEFKAASLRHGANRLLKHPDPTFADVFYHKTIHDSDVIEYLHNNPVLKRYVTQYSPFLIEYIRKYIGDGSKIPAAHQAWIDEESG